MHRNCIIKKKLKLCIQRVLRHPWNATFNLSLQFFMESDLSSHKKMHSYYTPYKCLKWSLKLQFKFFHRSYFAQLKMSAPKELKLTLKKGFSKNSQNDLTQRHYGIKDTHRHMKPTYKGHKYREIQRDLIIVVTAYIVFEICI